MRAFDVFTREIAHWWLPSGLFRITRRGDGRLSFEPGAGGRLVTTFADGEQFEIGRISVWEPGRRLVFGRRQSSFTPRKSTQVEVNFEPIGAETRVSIEHRAWDTLPQEHAARHGFPEAVTLRHIANWWRGSLAGLREGISEKAAALPDPTCGRL